MNINIEYDELTLLKLELIMNECSLFAVQKSLKDLNCDVNCDLPTHTLLINLIILRFYNQCSGQSVGSENGLESQGDL